MRVAFTAKSARNAKLCGILNGRGRKVFDFVKKAAAEKPGVYKVVIRADTGKRPITCWERYFIVE